MNEGFRELRRTCPLCSFLIWNMEIIIMPEKNGMEGILFDFHGNLINIVQNTDILNDSCHGR